MKIISGGKLPGRKRSHDFVGQSSVPKKGGDHRGAKVKGYRVSLWENFEWRVKE